VSTTAFDPRALASVAVLAVLALAILRSWRAGGLIGLGGLWYAVALLPVSQIAPHHELMAEHYLYIPMIGIAVAAAGAIAALAVRFPERRQVLAAVATILVVAAAARTIARNRDWRDELTISAANVVATPGSARALVHLGHAYRERSRIAEAEQAFLTAAALRPDYLEPHVGLAMIYAFQQKDDLMREHIEAALRLAPKLGRMLVFAGWLTVDSDPERALGYFETALERRSDDAAAQTGARRARALLDARRRDAAREAGDRAGAEGGLRVLPE
jgi:Tfp pilus assembly protein PilF